MRRRQSKEINVFSTSAIDLFASGMGVFVILVVVALPKLRNTSDNQLDIESKRVEELHTEVNKLTQINSQFLKALTAQTKNLGKIDSQIRVLASIGDAAKTKVEGVQNVAETLQATQSVIKDLTNMVKVVNKQQEETNERLMQALSNLQMTKQRSRKMKESVESLRNQLQSRVEAKTQFVSVLLRWETSDHDLDLQIIDADDKLHSFKDKSATIFSDTRVGPGGEIWFLENPKPGTYKVLAYFHGKYGNEKPARVTLSLIDRQKVKTPPSQMLEKESETKELLQFTVDQRGLLSLVE